MHEIEFLVPLAYQGVRLKGFLRKHCGVSSRLLTKLKREPLGISVNGIHAIVTDFLQAGDCVRLILPRDEKFPEPAELPFPVVYEDADLLAVNKPAGMPMYPSPGHDCDSLANAFSAYFQKNGGLCSFRPIYRLDRDTTGLVILAKQPYAAACLAGKVRKTYLAICEGALRGSGNIRAPIGIKKGHTIQREVTPDGERAETRWRSLICGSHHSLLALHLKTGRTHQIRVHFSYLGHPLAGDDFYGGSRVQMDRTALHCAEIRLIHPLNGKMIRLTQGFPEDMTDLLNRIKIESIKP